MQIKHARVRQFIKDPRQDFRALADPSYGFNEIVYLHPILIIIKPIPDKL